MGLFHSDIGSEAQTIKIHHRRLRNTPLPNSIRFAHWALQVGDLFYEVAAPPKDFIKLKIADELVKDLSDTKEEEEEEEEEDDDDDDDNDEDDDDDSDLDNLESIVSKGTKGLKFSEDSYKTHSTEVWTVQGNRVPLQISQGKDWNRIRNIKSISCGTTYVKPQKVVERAVHIFQSSFSRKYDFYYYNCHAFVLELCFSITRIGRIDQCTFSRCQPPFAARNWIASQWIYCNWIQLMGARCPSSLRINATSTDAIPWDLKEKYINYDKIVPPQAMHRYYFPVESSPDHRVPQHRLHNATTHVSHRSHAAHMNSQEHALQQNILNQIINTSVTQQMVSQALPTHSTHSYNDSSSSWNNAGTNPIAFGLGPAMGMC
ncbi:MAG: hypothetical protein Q9191_007981 [Dirinaria sp. TL-2023a]